MARNKAYRWRGFGEQASGNGGEARPRGKGITNKQAAYLAALQKKAGLPYSGSGMTRRQASSEIDRLLGHPKREPRVPRAVKELDREFDRRLQRE